MSKMGDNTGRLILTRLRQFWSNMAEHIDDVVYTDESKEMFNIVNIIIIAWLALGMIVYFVASAVLSKSKKSSDTKAQKVHSNGETSTPRNNTEMSKLASDKKENYGISKIQSSANTSKEPSVIVSTATTSSFDPYFESYEVSNIPQTYGTNKNAVAWANKVLNWIYQNAPTYNPIIIDSLLNSINKKTRELALEYGILIEAEQSLVSESGAPSFTNLYTTLDAKGNVVTTVKCEMHQFPLNLLVTQLKDNQKLSLHYNLVLESLKGKLKADYIVSDYLFLLRFTGTPEVNLFLKPVDDTLPDSQTLEAKLKHMLLRTINTLEVEMSFDREKDFPVYKKPNTVVGNSPAPTKSDSNKHKLLVRIIKADNLGGKKGCKAPYCVLELDEPSQRFETTTWTDVANPAWNQMFYFTLGPNSEDLLLELYDNEKKPPQDNFLGLGIVSIAELLRNPRQKHEIVLQNRPNEDTDVTGSLTVEFLMNEGEDFPHLGSGQGKIIETNSRTTATGTIITTTTIKRAAEDEERQGNKESVAADVGEQNAPCLEAADLQKFDEEPTDTIIIVRAISGKPEKKVEISSPLETKPKELLLSSAVIDTPNHDNKNKNASNEQIPFIEESNCSVIPPNDISKSISQTITKKDELIHMNGEPEDASPILKDSEYVIPITKKDKHIHMNGQPEDASPIPKDAEDPILLNGEPAEVSSIPNSDPAITPLNEIEQSFNSETPKNHIDPSSNCIETLPSETSTVVDEETSSVNTIIPNEVEPEQVLSNANSKALTDEGAPSSSQTKEEELGGDSLADTALKQIEAKEKNGHPSKTTLIIHKVARPLSPSEETLVPRPLDEASSSIVNDDDMSVTKPKEKGTFMKSLKKKLSFNRKSRSRSVDQYNQNGGSQLNGRSVSSDRSHSSSTTPRQGFKSFLTVTRPKKEANGDQSSVSGASGISSASNRTFVNESSTLMIETVENGVVKRLIVPPSLANKSKWRKIGVKLHVFNNHTFVARHISGQELCQVCRLAITRRFGKQGYVCRDCNMICHKPCHIKSEGFCPTSNINKLEAEYVQDPKASKIKAS